MKEYRAKLSHLRISPRKTRLVAGLVRGLSATDATQQLKASPKRSSVAVLKLLNSAISNAKNDNEDIQESDLFIKKIFVDEGPKLKRYRPVSRGSVHEIQKKTSHVTLVLSERDKSETQEKKPKTNSKPQKTNNKASKLKAKS
ncbi:MAG: 50S ribosomal protein L22 [Candidatus Spechtbacterales bacterium]